MMHESKSDMLRQTFWTALFDDQLKSQTRHKNDSMASFNTFLREIRTVEKEIQISITSTILSSDSSTF